MGIFIISWCSSLRNWIKLRYHKYPYEKRCLGLHKNPIFISSYMQKICSRMPLINFWYFVKHFGDKYGAYWSRCGDVGSCRIHPKSIAIGPGALISHFGTTLPQEKTNKNINEKINTTPFSFAVFFGLMMRTVWRELVERMWEHVVQSSRSQQVCTRPT